MRSQIMKLVVVCCALFNISGAYASGPDYYVFGEKDNTVVFHCTGNVELLSFDGVGGKVDGQVSTAADGSYVGKLTVNLLPFKTGIDLRNEHLHKKYLQTDKFSSASLVLKEGFKGSGKFCGDLTIKDIKKPVCGVATVEDAINGKRVKASFDAQLSDFGLHPMEAKVAVDDTVKVTIDALAIKKS